MPKWPKCKNIPVLISLYKFAVRTGYPRQTRFLPQWTDNVKNIPKNNEKLSSKNKLTSYEILKKKKTWGTGSCRTVSYGSDGQSYKTLHWKNHIVSCITHFQLCCRNRSKKKHIYHYSRYVLKSAY